jgi:DNA-binding NarL/FixJ family response regulator
MRRVNYRNLATCFCRDFVELVAEGLTNGEIAARLVISRGTVRRHLENVFEKLNVHTRTAAAAYLSDLRRTV